MKDMNSKHHEKQNIKMYSLGKRVWKYRFQYLLILPGFLFIILFKYVPMYGITLAFKDFKPLEGILGSPWVGLKYFRQIFTSYSFLQVLGNTLHITFRKLIFGFTAPIVLALFVNEIRNERVKKLFQTVSYLPHFLSWVIVAALVGNIAGSNGPIAWLVSLFGGNPKDYLSYPQYFRTIVIVSDVWKSAGWGSILYLAAIVGIDPQLYEAAEMDGANRFHKIWHITLPGIRSTIITLFIMSVGGILSAGFDQIYNLYRGSTMSTGDVLDTFVYRQGIVSANYSYATAAGLFVNVVGFMMLLCTNVVVKKLSDGEEGIW